MLHISRDKVYGNADKRWRAVVLVVTEGQAQRCVARSRAGVPECNAAWNSSKPTAEAGRPRSRYQESTLRPCIHHPSRSRPANTIKPTATPGRLKKNMTVNATPAQRTGPGQAFSGVLIDVRIFAHQVR
jgi:hypothetical protein